MIELQIVNDTFAAVHKQSNEYLLQKWSCICVDLSTIEGMPIGTLLISLACVCTSGSLMRHGLSQLSSGQPQVLRKDISMTPSQPSQVHQGS